MFNFFRKKEKTKIEEFYEKVHETAFPNGDKQIKEEVEVIFNLLKEKIEKAYIKSALLKGTIYLFLGFLENENDKTSISSEWLFNRLKQDGFVEEVSYQVSIFIFKKEQERI